MRMFPHHHVPRFPRLCSFTPLAIVLSHLCLTAALTQDSKIRCTAQSVTPLQETVLICYFPEDLSMTKKDFTVYRYAKDGSSSAVIDCWWLSSKLDCYTNPIFQYSQTVGTNLTVTIREVTSALTGIYACQVAGYKQNSLETCEIKFEIGTKTTCSITHKRSESQANLNCFFDEDIAKTRRNFAVYRHSGQDKQIVANCSWEDTRPRCQMEHGYLSSDDVSSYTTLRILNVTKNKCANYSCWHAGSISGQQETCQHYVENNVPKNLAPTVHQTFNTWALVLGLMTSSLLLLAAGVVILLVYKGKIQILRPLFMLCNAEPDGEERLPMAVLSANQDAIDVENTTKQFHRFLIDNVTKTYQEILDSSYFVPPVYFNKTRYRTEQVAKQRVYVPVVFNSKNAKDIKDIKHDRAMQHVMHCLQHMADQRQEKMFVLTQFNYDDYLNNPGTDFQQHRLPVPSGVVDEDEDVACFDFLIVHREHGVLVGVVKAVSDKVEDSTDGQQEAGGSIVTAVTEAVQQLQKANRMIRHLLSDQQQFPTVRQTLILPNLSHASLYHAVDKDNDLVERLREFLDVTAIEDPTEQCLCAEDLSDPSSPWVVSPAVVNRLRDRWRWKCPRVDNDVVMNDDLYLNVIARFCGPATQSTLDIQDKPYLLPKTLAEAVSLTGDLYQRWTLHPDMVKTLNEKRLFLVGPSNNDKTRMLTLAGKMWLSQGHQVYLLLGSSGPRDSVMSTFCDKFKDIPETKDTKNSSQVCLVVLQCDLTSKKNVKKTLANLQMNGENSLCVIAEEIDVHGRHFRSFCKTLINRCPDLHFWATSSTDKNVPAGWKIQTFTRALYCPPAVFREASWVVADYFISGGKQDLYNCLPPTDGPKVKYFNHKKSPPWVFHDCRECSKDVADFLTNHLIKKNVVRPNEASVTSSKDILPGRNNSTPLKTPSILQNKDVLVLFECDFDDFNEKEQFLRGLNEYGLTFGKLWSVNGKYFFEGKNDFVCTMHGNQLDWYTPRKKVVVYVERHDSKNEFKKRLGITTCTSQLIVVRGNY